MKKMDSSSHLILNRTSKQEVAEGITVITRGEGVYVFDQDGKRYIDLVSGVFRPVHVGYGRKEIAQAVYDQICDLPYFCPSQFSNVPAMELAEVLAGITPGKINRFFFVCDGSEAVETAIKLARHHHEYTGEKKRNKIISRRGAYHGTTGGALRALGTVLQMRQIMEPLTPGTVFVESPYCYRCPLHLAYPGCDVACARDVARIIEFEDPGQISAFIGEPIQQGFGALAPVKEYWKIIRDMCDAYGILLIVDEVICGFGRTGKWFGIDHFDIQPDLITMAKGLSSGYVPLGGVGCTDQVMDPIEIFMHVHTYSNHPVACAAGLKNIEVMKEEELVERSDRMGRYFLEALRSLEPHAIVGEVRGTGLWAAIDFTTNKKSRASFPIDRLTRLVRRAKEKGLIVKVMGQALEFAPPLIIEEAEIDESIKILDECIRAEEEDMQL
ncbi:MAG: aminotransferase class III-fold pyridoxal phosphate-dependent enzyme [Proteobacteria bacterium]|nr:aminotransferase class III-fold pyridoxal phosphate-dependent enzyme [Pseudomonadota bacterium]NIS71030.1 aminotransferase class III-fold pyridoxal phosphate-dependent enzyme [Pseudomonadota bacterium]